MFSGIIEEVGTLASRQPAGQGLRLEIRCGLPLGPQAGSAPGARVKLGDSIAVMGACLTVESLSPAGPTGGTFSATLGIETVQRTTLGQRRPGDPLHLERALRAGDRLDGHIVSGHVDGVGRVLSLRDQGESWILWVSAPPELARYLAEKGSICIDGVSLTVNELRDESDGSCAFRVNLVPFTIQHTAFGGYGSGRELNLEVDLLARYTERLLRAPGGREAPGQARLSAERLVELGYAPTPRNRGG